MKKLLPFAILFGILTTLLILPSCSAGNDETSSEKPSSPSSEAPSDESSAAPQPPSPDENAPLIWNETYADENAGLNGPDDIFGAKYYFDGKLTADYAKDPGEGDGKYIFCGEDASRFVNVAEGYMITLPGAEVTGDFTLSKNRSKLFAKNAVVTISKEDQSPYGNTPGGWETYLTEWINVLIDDLNYLAANNIMRTTQAKTHTDLIEGYEVMQYDMYIKLPKEIERPYYNIAIIRKTGEYVKHYLVVMKSDEKAVDSFRTMIGSMRFFEPEGKADNHIGKLNLKIPENWTEETKAYFEKLSSNDVPDWGFFYARNDRDYINWLTGETAINYDPEIFMTYLHIGFYNNLNYLDTALINDCAGGDGFNGKPVLNLTYQFTTTNNNIAGYTPMFDILRGNYDDHFRRLARDIKAYGKPVIFRLNNEMNTDWTSYCGVATLLDPDIFILTWQRLYDIFIEEGVNNTIWVFNPINVTCPYCDWGAYLTYFPGEEYVQMLGLTDYESGNGNLTSFKTMYTNAYNQYVPQFGDYPWMIGEFACGAGGAKQFDWGIRDYKDTVEGRAQPRQAEWVEEMFKCFTRSTEEGYEFAHKIKAAVWFSANDSVTIEGVDYIVNYYHIDDRLDKTIAKLREWLPKIHEKD